MKNEYNNSLIFLQASLNLSEKESRLYATEIESITGSNRFRIIFLFQWAIIVRAINPFSHPDERAA